MRWFSVGLLCALAGCAKLNGAFDDSKASGTGGAGTTGVETPPRTATDDATTDDSATTHGLGTTDDGTTTHHDETGDEGSSSTNGIKVPTPGSTHERTRSSSSTPQRDGGVTRAC